MSVTLRHVSQYDHAFLFQLYSQTRIDEIGARDWDPKQQEFFLRMQFNAQQQFYHATYTDADYRIILLNEQPIGWIVIARRDDEMLVVDIALIPEWRNAGIGTLLLRHGSNERDNYSFDEIIVKWPLTRLEAFFSRLLNRSIVTLYYA